MKIGKLILSTLMAIAATSATASNCLLFSRNITVDVEKVKNEKFTYDMDAARYEEICRKLMKANAGIAISGKATVLANTSVAWVSIAIYDLKTHVSTDAWSSGTHVYSKAASIDVAQDMLRTAISGAVSELPVDKAIDELNTRLAKARKN